MGHYYSEMKEQGLDHIARGSRTFKDKIYEKYTKDIASRRRLQNQALALIQETGSNPNDFFDAWHDRGMPDCVSISLPRLIALDLMNQGKLIFTTKGNYLVKDLK